MKKISIFTISIALSACLFTACKPAAYTPDDVFFTEDQVQELLNKEPNGYKVYHLHEFLDTFMTETGNKYDQYRTRSHVNDGGKDYYLFSIDTLPVQGRGIYIRGRITTDDYGGNFYKAMVIQEIVDGKQQNLRLSVDIGSASGLYQLGQEILIRCNGLSVGRYANQPQLCVPSYNNNINAQKAEEKVGWAPGRIPNAVFRRATTLIGQPDPSKIKCDVIKITDFFSVRNLIDPRKMDAMFVELKNVKFTCEYDSFGTPTPCHIYNPMNIKDSVVWGDPESDQYAAVFGPTTNNVGFPQSRIIMDENGNRTLVSTSEYAKYAYYMLPTPEYVGSVYGILGFYVDNGRYGKTSDMDGYEWSITPRDILRIKDVLLYNPAKEEWIPEEFIPILEE